MRETFYFPLSLIIFPLDSEKEIFLLLLPFALTHFHACLFQNAFESFATMKPPGLACSYISELFIPYMSSRPLWSSMTNTWGLFVVV